MRKPTRTTLIAVPAVLLLATAAACSSSSSPSATHTGTSTSSTPSGGAVSASGTALQVTSSSSLGQIVTTGSGMTVYRYDADTANSGTSACTGGCAAAWPPVLYSGTGTPKVNGVSSSLVGEITRSDGTKQLTLDGWPLYTYAGDQGPGSTAGQGSGGTWWAVTPAGAKAGSVGGGSTAPTPTPSPSTGGGGGGNY